jgi:monomeric sarcosine oxidase
MAPGRAFDVAVIGAGVFGAWTAYFLRKSGARVILLDAYGPASARASSGGESRIIRMGYGADEIYTRWSLRALPMWKQFFAEVGRHELFQATGVLWIAHEGEPYAQSTLAALEQSGARFEKLKGAELRRRYPQIVFDEDAWGILEPESGVLMARRAVHAVVEQARRIGVEYQQQGILPPETKGRVTSLKTTQGETISAANYVFACGPWLAKLFPALLGPRMFISRQEIFFYGIPAGDSRFAPPAMPTWLQLRDEFYGMPDLESRGFKIANDRHGAAADPDAQSRVPSAEALAAAREFIARRFPALANAPVTEARVCQYENTSSGDFLIDRHPHHENVWLAGGGSGHGFKHGPVFGEYLAERVLRGGEIEPRFLLATKQTVQSRAIH